MVLSALSVLLGFIVLVVTLDHLGSHRVRNRVRQRAIRLFAEAKALPASDDNTLSQTNRSPLETVRLKLKRSRRLSPKGGWFPVEAKLFFTPFPIGGAYYADWTRAPFVSQKEVRWLEGARSGEERRLFSLFSLPAKKDSGLQLAWWLVHAPWYPSLLHHPDLRVVPQDDKRVQLSRTGDENWSVRLFAGDDGQWSVSELIGFRQKNEVPLIRCHWSNYKKFDVWSIPTELITQHYNKGSWWKAGQTQLTDWVANEEFAWW